MNKKPIKNIDELTKGYDDFMKGKKPNKNIKQDFEKVLKKAVKKKEN